MGMMNPHSLTARVLGSPLMTMGTDFANPAYRGVEFPAHGDIGQASTSVASAVYRCLGQAGGTSARATAWAPGT
jgi:hypothetical protein